MCGGTIIGPTRLWRPIQKREQLSKQKHLNPTTLYFTACTPPCSPPLPPQARHDRLGPARTPARPRRRAGHRAADRPGARLAPARSERGRARGRAAHVCADRAAGRRARQPGAHVRAVAAGGRPGGPRLADGGGLRAQRPGHGRAECHHLGRAAAHAGARRLCQLGGHRPGTGGGRGRDGVAEPQAHAAWLAAADQAPRAHGRTAIAGAVRGHPAVPAQRRVRALCRAQPLCAVVGGDPDRRAVAGGAFRGAYRGASARVALDRHAGRPGLVHRRHVGPGAARASTACPGGCGGHGHPGGQCHDVPAHGRAAGRHSPTPAAYLRRGAGVHGCCHGGPEPVAVAPPGGAPARQR